MTARNKQYVIGVYLWTLMFLTMVVVYGGCCSSGWKHFNSRSYCVEQKKILYDEAGIACQNVSADLVFLDVGKPHALHEFRDRLQLSPTNCYWIDTNKNGTCDRAPWSQEDGPNISSICTIMCLSVCKKQANVTNSYSCHHAACKGASSMETNMPTSTAYEETLTNSTNSANMRTGGDYSPDLRTGVTISGDMKTSATNSADTQTGATNSSVTYSSSAESTERQTDSTDVSFTNANTGSTTSTENQNDTNKTLATPRSSSNAEVTNAKLTQNEWIATYRREFLVNTNIMNYTKAGAYCKGLDASLTSFTNARQYLNLSNTLSLESETSYWVGNVVRRPMCVLLMVNKTDGNSIRIGNCSEARQSICSRAANISDILNDPVLVKMIEEMTIDAKKTGRARRERRSIWDGRRSAMTIGQCGIFVLAAVATVIVLCDLPRLIRFWTHTFKKKEEVGSQIKRVSKKNIQKKTRAVRRGQTISN